MNPNGEVGDKKSFRRRMYLSKLILPPLGVSATVDPKSSPSWIISPYDSRYRLWETSMVVLATFSMWVYPLEIAFFSSFVPTELYIADNLVNLFFAIDIVLTFLVSYIDPPTQLLVCEPRKIAVREVPVISIMLDFDDYLTLTCRYLSTWFVMDVASTIPFEALRYAFTRKAREGTTYVALGLLRFWRLWRVFRLFTRLEKDIRFNYFLIRSLRLLAVTLLSAHCAGCLDYLLADRYRNQNNTWLGKEHPKFKETSLWVRYISSLYWSITTMTTVGYGDFHAMNTIEMAVTSLYMLFNLALTSYLIGNITNLVLEGSRRTKEFRKTIQAASQFVSRNKLPPSLKDQIFTYMYLKFEAESLSQHKFVNQLPKSIYKNISQHLFLPIVEKTYLFQGVSPTILSLLVLNMEAQYFPPKEDVIMQNEAPDDVYIIVSGEVELIATDTDKRETVSGILESSDLFGEIDALLGKPHSYSFRTKVLSQLLRLKTHDLIHKMQAKPEDNAKILQNLLQHNKGHKDLESGAMVVNMERDDDQTMLTDMLAPSRNNDFLNKFLTTKKIVMGDPKGKAPILRTQPSKGHWSREDYVPRVSIYKGHPLAIRSTTSMEPGRVVKLPNLLEELKEIAGEKFGFDATNSMVMNEDGAQIECMEVIRDDDKLFII